MGAIGTWYLAARHPHLFSAAVSISGIPNPRMIERQMNTPVYVIQSRGDELFPMDSVNDFIGNIESRSSSVKLMIVEGLSHYQTSEFIEPLREAIPWIKKAWKHKE
jgi:predicted peptidase